MAWEYSHRISGRRVSRPDLAHATMSSIGLYIGQTRSVTGASAYRSCMSGPS